jgi:hypothetical protein
MGEVSSVAGMSAVSSILGLTGAGVGTGRGFAPRRLNRRICAYRALRRVSGGRDGGLRSGVGIDELGVFANLIYGTHPVLLSKRPVCAGRRSAW